MRSVTEPIPSTRPSAEVALDHQALLRAQEPVLEATEDELLLPTSSPGTSRDAAPGPAGRRAEPHPRPGWPVGFRPAGPTRRAVPRPAAVPAVRPAATGAGSTPDRWRGASRANGSHSTRPPVRPPASAQRHPHTTNAGAVEVGGPRHFLNRRSRHFARTPWWSRRRSTRVLRLRRSEPVVGDCPLRGVESIPEHRHWIPRGLHRYRFTGPVSSPPYRRHSHPPPRPTSHWRSPALPRSQAVTDTGVREL